ncbi:MAG: hypothetical protein AB7H93_21330 [Vicinamibacterales bacterium]
MMLRLGPIGAITLALWGVMVGAAYAQPVLNAPTVVGANVTFSWGAGPGGTTSYNLEAGTTPGGPYFAAFNVGNVTGVAVTAPAIGVYYVRVVALPSAAVSNEVQVVVNSLVAPPAAPTGLQVFRNGGNVVISWTPGAGGGPVTAFQLRAGLTPGGAQIGVIPTAATGFAAGGVPPNTYYLGVRAVNAAGVSAESSEVALVMPPGGACDAPPTPALTTTAWGPYLTANWSPIPGAGAYLFSASGPGFTGGLAFPGNQTTFVYPSLPLGTWNFGIQAQFSCGSTGGMGASQLIVDGASLKMQPREPDPAPGQALPTPAYALSIVQQIGAQYDAELQQSCREHGGNNRWLFRLVNALRQRDKRWGLNWKRANVGDMSQDIVTFNWSSDPDEGTFNTRVYDVIGNHCGSGRVGAQLDEKTILGSTGAKWTLIPYIQAGYIP